jgi:hypothetical protein
MTFGKVKKVELALLPSPNVVRVHGFSHTVLVAEASGFAADANLGIKGKETTRTSKMQKSFFTMLVLSKCIGSKRLIG